MNTRFILMTCAFLSLLVGCSEQTQNPVGSENADSANTSEPVATSITNGMPVAEFLRIFGEPKGRLSRGSKELMLYEDFQVSLVDNTVNDIPVDMEQIYKDLTAPSTLDKIKDVKISIPAPRELKAALAKRKSFAILDSHGNPVDHSKLVSSGKVTVVQFYVEGSPGSALIQSNLTDITSAYERVAFKQIDIVSWDSDLSRKYHIGSVPDIRVLDPYGNLISQPVTRLETVEGHVDLERVKVAIEKAL